ncbi:hypothetical protein BZA05DRAFT_472014 [Tricharina praecox]|uniref:uncharacterized protein n=1 Tax=Tricharina praecox TaxID=43433 RepID=UPI00221E5BB1|nr:uncharacterized protein BZA05DRAFT_472014 [Tricharina praecox]KAI5856049.1 hypothetical protein BZA05DRAFT_472014 [Tricharina praecox]
MKSSTGSPSGLNPAAAPFVPKSGSSSPLNAAASPSAMKGDSPDRRSTGGSSGRFNPTARPFVPGGVSPNYSNPAGPNYVPSGGLSQEQQQHVGYYDNQVYADGNQPYGNALIPATLENNDPAYYEWSRDVLSQQGGLEQTGVYYPQAYNYSSQMYAAQNELPMDINMANSYGSELPMDINMANSYGMGLRAVGTSPDGAPVYLDNQLPRNETVYYDPMGQIYKLNLPPYTGSFPQEQYGNGYTNIASSTHDQLANFTDATFTDGHQENFQTMGMGDMDVNAGTHELVEKTYASHDDAYKVNNDSHDLMNRHSENILPQKDQKQQAMPVTEQIQTKTRKLAVIKKDPISEEEMTFGDILNEYKEQKMRKRARKTAKRGKGKARAASESSDSESYEHPAEKGDILGDDGELMHLYEAPETNLMFSDEERLYFTELIDAYMAAYSTPIREVNMSHLFKAYRHLRANHHLTEGPDRSNAELFVLYLAEISDNHTVLSLEYEAYYEKVMGHLPDTIQKNQRRLLSKSHEAARDWEIYNSLLWTDAVINIAQHPDLRRELDEEGRPMLVLFKAINRCYKASARRLEPFWCSPYHWRQSPFKPKKPEDTYVRRRVADKGVFADPVLDIHPDSEDERDGAAQEIPKNHKFAGYWPSEEIFLRGLLKLHLVLYPAAPFDWDRITAAFNKVNTLHACRGIWRSKMELRHHFKVLYPEASALARIGMWKDIHLWEERAPDPSSTKRGRKLGGRPR